MTVSKAQIGARVDGTGAVFVNDIQVVGEQGSAVADITPAADGTTAGTAVNAILAAMRAHGLIVT